MSANEPLVLDASVATKWHLRDEAYSERARAVRIDFEEGRVQLAAPDHIRYEVANALRVAAVRGRISEIEGRTAVREFLSWGIRTVRTDELILAAYDASVTFGCALYDGLYLALALATKSPLIYADDALRRRLGGSFPLALWIGDYR
jgi:predicted nucleic acid-binding protein